MLISSILSLLCSSAVTLRRDKSIFYARSVIAILITGLIINLNNFELYFQYKNFGLFHGLFNNTAITNVFSIFIFIISALILQLNSFYNRKLWIKEISSFFSILLNKLVYFNNFILNKMSEQYRILEYSFIMLFIIIGGIFLMSSCNLISIFLCIELQSYGLYILCSLYRDSEKAVSAGLMYFLLGGLSSCFILLSSGLLYANSGNVNLDGLFIINNIASASDEASANDFKFMNINLIDNLKFSETAIISLYQSYYINFSLIIMSIGFLFKVTAAPFHFWAPDVYDAIPTIVTTFVAVFAKISIFIFLLQLVNYAGDLFINKQDSVNGFSFSWTFTFLFSSLLSMIIGSVLGLTQFRIKRLYAYSTINHIGFILLALAINSIESIQSFIFYLLQYSLANLNAFMLLIAMGYSLYIYVEKDNNLHASDDMDNAQLVHERKNSPIQLISQIKGYFYVNPVLAISFALTLFSFVGIPPLIGFFAKQMVLSSALDSGYIFISIIAILTSVISAYYYLALIKQVFFLPTDYIINPQLNNVNIPVNIISRINNDESRPNKSYNLIINKNTIVLSGSLTITIALLTLTILLFMLNPQEWLSLANILALIMFNC